MKAWMWACLAGAAAVGALVLLNHPTDGRAAPPASSASATNATAGAAVPDYADPAKLTARAPETFRAQFNTTKGPFVVEVTRALAPRGADRFYNLVRSGYFTDVAFFRVVPGFMCQFGISGNPAVAANWREATIPDDPVKGSNTRGTITFATAGPNTRTTQLFINYANNTFLDAQGFAPIGKVIEGMDVVDKLNGQYGDGPPSGQGPDQGRIQTEGNAYLKKDFPGLDYIKSATILPADDKKAPAKEP
ncbi:MAG TPA: peptidylprolyl isomerase [Verrucomicrobiae bacterium]|nr:peptidylprolyl isomerase [Verrucomicrobiae bacterium]